MEQAAVPSDPIQPAARSILERIRRDSLRFNIVSLKRDIDACAALLGEDPIIDVAILGQFKAGKSSFINSLIGQDVLPVGVVPVTTVITRLAYGRTPKGIVTHFDGGAFDIDIGDVGEFVSEKKNPANGKNVEVVDIELPSLERYRGLRFVDRPAWAVSSGTTPIPPRAGCPGWGRRWRRSRRPAVIRQRSRSPARSRPLHARGWSFF